MTENLLRPYNQFKPKEGFEYRTTFQPGYDLRDHPKNYGICDMRIRFILIGELGATQFMMGTNWYPQSVDTGSHLFKKDLPMGWDVGYHALSPKYEDQEPMDCDIFGRCYYDGSGLHADEWVKKFIERGTDFVWESLHKYYSELFKGENVA